MIEISIHTSAREVTKSWSYIKNASEINPHFRKGSDGVHDRTSEARMDFNPHFRKEVTACAVMAYVDTNDFNPHFRKGSDQSSRSHIDYLKISIHTSAREVTGSSSKPYQGCNHSIHTSAREVTIFRDRREDSRLHFNPHFRKGSDLHPSAPS